ncbi:MAG: DegT/DnrJ/EryC1/StrS family aminotransferase, partial [Planctomycetota bacterium]
MLRGSTAIWEAFRLLDLPRGSEVLFPTYHCGLELDVLAKAGLRPVFYGVTDSLGIDIDDLESRITASTQAVYVIHYFGFPHDLPSLRALCDRRGLRLIEDGAQAFASAMPRGGDAPRAVGTFGDVGIFSLHKSLPVPDGGALVLNDPDLPPPRLARRPGWFETLQHAKLILARDLYKVGAIRGVLRWLLLGVLSPC